MFDKSDNTINVALTFDELRFLTTMTVLAHHYKEHLDKVWQDTNKRFNYDTSVSDSDIGDIVQKLHDARKLLESQ